MECRFYLFNSILFCSGEENSSSWETAISEVPQLLFFIYVNDLLCGLYHIAKLVIYADSTNVIIITKII